MKENKDSNIFLNIGQAGLKLHMKETGQTRMFCFVLTFVFFSEHDFVITVKARNAVCVCL